MKKIIKIAFSGYGDSFFGFSFHDNYLVNVLKEKYDIRFSSIEDADFVFCGIWARPFEYCGVNQVRIMVQGENYIPDFNLIDYAISSYPLQLGDRNYFVPCGVESLIVQKYSHFVQLQKKQFDNVMLDSEFLKKKEFFCNFLVGHDSEYNLRTIFFKKLSEYKRIESAGTLMNNMPNHTVVAWRDESKLELQKKCKFTICFESTNNQGFITEKIVDAFLADTIPIYYGSDIVNDIFNPDSFIRCNSIESFDEVIDRIIELDNNDFEYLEMLNKPKLRNGSLPTEIVDGYKEFLFHIFDQNPKEAYRRSRVYSPKEINDYCLWTSKYYPLYLKEKKKKKKKMSNSIKLKARKIVGNGLYEKIKSVIK